MTKQSKGTHRDRVKEWDTETDVAALVTLVPGFAFEPNRDADKAVHCKAFDSAREAKAAVKLALPCNCDRCAMGGKTKGSPDA